VYAFENYRLMQDRVRLVRNIGMMNGNYFSRVLLVIRDLYERVTSHACDAHAYLVPNNREIIQYKTRVTTVFYRK